MIAFATSLGTVVGGLMTLIYLLRFSRTLHLCRIKLSIKSLLLTLRNISYMIKTGKFCFISEAHCLYDVSGELRFIHHLGERRRAALCVLPVTSSLSSSRSIMPLHNPHNPLSAITSEPDSPSVYERKTLHLAIRTALICGISFSVHRTMLPRHCFIIH